MNKIPESEQWLLSGDCSVCRREKYCSKPCTKGKNRRTMVLKSMVVEAMLKVMAKKE